MKGRVDVRKSRSLKPLMPAVGAQTFHCVSYRESDTVREHGGSAASRRESGICADLTVNESFCWLSKLCHVLPERAASHARSCGASEV